MSFRDNIGLVAKLGKKTAIDVVAHCLVKGTMAWKKNEPALAKAFEGFQRSTKEFASSGYQETRDSIQGIVDSVRYSPGELDLIEKHIRYQGGYYRELNRKSTSVDVIMLGGESVASLALATAIPEQISRAYAAAYPDLSDAMSLQERLRGLEGAELQGLVSGIKGKLFEHQYVGYLNEGVLPDGYRAVLAESATQPGWDFRIEGPNGEIVEVLQAKATESSAYVIEALRAHPEIDVVTTEEVYGHLVMSGVSEGIVNSGISNSTLEQALGEVVSTDNLEMNFTPPWFTLALIAFTTYKDDSLTLYQKARSSGGRAGQAYLCYLLGGAVAAATNTWWLGMLGTVASRYTIAEGKRRRAVIDQARKVIRSNDQIIERIEGILQNKLA
jgi:hypothetical protein